MRSVGALVRVDAQEQGVVVDEPVVAHALAGRVAGHANGLGGVRHEEVLAVGVRAIVVVADVGGQRVLAQLVGGQELVVLGLAAGGVDLVAHAEQEVRIGVCGGGDVEHVRPRRGVSRLAAARTHLGVAVHEDLEGSSGAGGELVGLGPALGLGTHLVLVGGAGLQFGEGGLVEGLALDVGGAGAHRVEGAGRGFVALDGEHRRLLAAGIGIPDEVAFGRRGADVEDDRLELRGRVGDRRDAEGEGEAEQCHCERPDGPLVHERTLLLWGTDATRVDHGVAASNLRRRGDRMITGG